MVRLRPCSLNDSPRKMAGGSRRSGRAGVTWVRRNMQRCRAQAYPRDVLGSWACMPNRAIPPVFPVLDIRIGRHVAGKPGPAALTPGRNAVRAADRVRSGPPRGARPASTLGSPPRRSTKSFNGVPGSTSWRGGGLANRADEAACSRTMRQELHLGASGGSAPLRSWWWDCSADGAPCSCRLRTLNVVVVPHNLTESDKTRVAAWCAGWMPARARAAEQCA
jgi:hypothetical protein